MSRRRRHAPEMRALKNSRTATNKNVTKTQTNKNKLTKQNTQPHKNK